VLAISWNILFDEHDSEKIHTQKRIPVLLKILQETEAHIIALQEVTKQFLQILLETDWVKE
jgi:poly(A) polymerase